MNNDIEELQEELRRHNTRIEELEQELQQVRNFSTEKIKELQDEKEALENEVNELKKKIKCLEDDGQEKSARIKRLEDDGQEKSVQIENFFKEMASIRKELGFFVAKSQEQEKHLKNYMTKTDKLEKSRNVLYLGQLCANVMEAIYREVLPVYFERDDYKQPHLESIEQKIAEFCKTGYDQREAQRRWRRIRAEKIDADESKAAKFIQFMEEKLDKRNKEAHPNPLNKKELEDIAKELPGQEEQYCKRLIQIYFGY